MFGLSRRCVLRVPLPNVESASQKLKTLVKGANWYLPATLSLWKYSGVLQPCSVTQIENGIEIGLARVIFNDEI